MVRRLLFLATILMKSGEYSLTVTSQLADGPKGLERWKVRLFALFTDEADWVQMLQARKRTTICVCISRTVKVKFLQDLDSFR